VKLDQYCCAFDNQQLFQYVFSAFNQASILPGIYRNTVFSVMLQVIRQKMHVQSHIGLFIEILYTCIHYSERK
jgi:hypothetical protein